ncbi:unnamed protein product [Heterobilharzia americana]|nr:unnamed protein product [Heterobilharzia americana]
MPLPETMVKYFGLRYDPTTLKAQDTEECHVIFPGWGDTSTIEYLQSTGFRFYNYFGSLVRTLTMNKFFIKNFTLRGAPYDFRKLPCKQFISFVDLLLYRIRNRKEINLCNNSYLQ